MVHSSVLSQTVQVPQLIDNVKANPSLVTSLQDTEESFKTQWSYVPGQHVSTDSEAVAELKSQESMKKSMEKRMKEAAERKTKTEVMVDEGGRPRYTDSWLGGIVHEWID